MSEWWLLIAAFWFWYLVDCVKAARRVRFVLSRALGGGRNRASVSHGPIAVINASPLGWHVRTEDPPFSFSPEGLSNIPVGSAGRPAPLPEVARVWRWKEIRQLAVKRGRIYINGLPFCPVTPWTTVAELRELIDGCKNRVPADREAWLAGRLAGWFRPAHLRRQQKILFGRTANLAIWASCGFGLSLVLSAYLLAGGLWPMSAGLAARIGRMLPLLGLYLLGLHGCIVIAGWRMHRRLMPKKGEERFSLIFSALLLPPQAYRLRSRIGAEYFKRAHPLAWLAAVGRQDAFVVYARQALMDLRWPMEPHKIEDGSQGLHQAIGCWMRLRMEGELGRLMQARGVTEEELLAVPERDGAESCAYCPRCGSQFTTPGGRCPNGIELKRF